MVSSSTATRQESPSQPARHDLNGRRHCSTCGVGMVAGAQGPLHHFFRSSLSPVVAILGYRIAKRTTRPPGPPPSPLGSGTPERPLAPGVTELADGGGRSWD